MRRVRQVLFGATCVFLFGVTAGAAERIRAFPGAEGFGAYVRGGRGGRAVEVTNLNADGPGSLQAACNVRGPRIVVFKVSGIIDGTVAIRQPLITIAGQTAPGDGICIRRGKLRVLTNEVIVRHMRSRPGDHPYGPAGSSRDCIVIGGRNVRDVILDHCSFSWGADENLDAYGPVRNLTVQWCIISESLHDSLHAEGPHGTGVLLGVRDNTISIHHCLIAHNMGRSPLMANHKGKAPATFDCRNNVIYNHGPWQASTMHGPMRVNYVGNFIKPGRNQHRTRRRGLLSKDGYKNKRIYVKDNIWPGPPEFTKDPWRIVGADVRPRFKPAPEAARLYEPVRVPPVTTEPVRDAYESVLRYAGCARPVRDVVDARIAAEARAGTGHIIDSPKYVGGWPNYATAAPPADTDHDGMPDPWEKRFGLDPADKSDGPKDLDGDGFTNVEEYLNETDPTKPDSGAPIAQRPPKIQKGNDAIRAAAARALGAKVLAEEQKPQAAKAGRQTFIRKVRQSGRDPAEVLGIRFARIPPGELMVYKVKVTLTRPYELSACEITQAQWEAVMGARPWVGKPASKDGPDGPVTYVSYIDCQEFISRLNAALPVRGTQTGGGRQYRLPTQCEWLHAARGGTKSRFGFPFPPRAKEDVLEYARVSLRYRDQRGYHEKLINFPEPVGRRKPNPWGLYNIAGNVGEWCHDRHSYQYYSVKRHGPTKTDPMGPKHGEYRLVCGGNFRFNTDGHRVWTWHKPHYRAFGLGFRLRRAVP